MAIVVNQAAYRFRNDDGSESAATWIAAENTDISLATGANRKFRLRFRIDVPVTPVTDTYKVQYAKNAGAYADVTGATSACQLASTASGYSDHDPTTNQMTIPPGGYSFVAGSIQTNDGSSASVALVGRNFTELEFMLTTIDADLIATDFLDFRLAFSSGTAIGQLAVPRITMQGSVTGIGAVTVGPVSLAGTGAVAIAGTGAVSVGPVSLAGTGTSGQPQPLARTYPGKVTIPRTCASLVIPVYNAVVRIVRPQDEVNK